MPLPAAHRSTIPDPIPDRTHVIKNQSVPTKNERHLTSHITHHRLPCIKASFSSTTQNITENLTLPTKFIKSRHLTSSPGSFSSHSLRPAAPNHCLILLDIWLVFVLAIPIIYLHMARRTVDNQIAASIKNAAALLLVARIIGCT